MTITTKPTTKPTTATPSTVDAPLQNLDFANMLLTGAQRKIIALLQDADSGVVQFAALAGSGVARKLCHAVAVDANTARLITQWDKSGQTAYPSVAKRLTVMTGVEIAPNKAGVLAARPTLKSWSLLDAKGDALTNLKTIDARAAKFAQCTALLDTLKIA